LEDVGYLEGTQFSKERAWVRGLQNSLRRIDVGLVGGAVVAGPGLITTDARTVALNPDATSIMVGGDKKVAVGVISDAQHGARGATTPNGVPLQPLVTASAPGFMSTVDKAKLDGISSSASGDLSGTYPNPIVTGLSHVASDVSLTGNNGGTRFINFSTTPGP